MTTASALPSESLVERVPVAPPKSGASLSLVMLVHPRCPCTRASLGELQAILDDCHQRLSVDLLIYHPRSRTEPSWSVEEFRRQQANLERPGLHFIDDLDGKLSARLGLKVSGHLLVVDHEGNVRFSGGLTAGRGHAVAGDGADAVRALLSGTEPHVRVAPVFGCTTLTPSRP